MNPAIRTRPALEEDVPRLVDVARRSWLSGNCERAPIDAIREWLADDLESTRYLEIWPRVLVAELGHRLVGLGSTESEQVADLWVHPSFQRQGIGTALLAVCEDRIRREGHPCARLQYSERNDTMAIPAGSCPGHGTNALRAPTQSSLAPPGAQRGLRPLGALLAALLTIGGAGTPRVAWSDEVAGADTQRWSVLPVAGYSTETTLFLGAMAVHYLPPRPQTRGSSVPVVGFGSIKRQYQLLVAPELYTAGNRYYAEADLVVQKWPANVYPRGNDAADVPLEYEARGFEVELALQRSVRDRWFFGPTARLAWDDITWEQDGAGAGYRGGNGGYLSALGLTASYDTRDIPNAPGAGAYVSTSLALHRSWLGSDHDFVAYLVEVRRYLGLGRGRVVAVAADLQLLSGDPPFTEWSTPDGTDLLRGIENGRYRDQHLLSLQAEYRWSLGARFGGVTFVDAAQVAPTVGDFAPDEMHLGLGAGLRYALNAEQRFHLRFDTAWVDGGPGFVFTAGEAF